MKYKKRSDIIWDADNKLYYLNFIEFRGIGFSFKDDEHGDQISVDYDIGIASQSAWNPKSAKCIILKTWKYYLRKNLRNIFDNK